MSSSDFLIDAATRHSVFLQRHAGQVSLNAQDVLARMQAEIVRQISAEPPEFQRIRLKRLMETVTRAIDSHMTELNDEIVEAVFELAKSEANFSVNMFNQVSTVPLLSPTEDVLRSAIFRNGMDVETKAGVLTIREAIDQFAKGKAREIISTINDAVTNGVPTNEAAKQIAELIGTRHSRQVNTLARTITNFTSVQARQMVLADNAAIVDRYEWVAVLDHRTTLLCFPADTLVVPLGTLKTCFRRKYVGDMITITTASGNKIKGTPNHPVLTNRGWLPLHEVEPNKHILYAPVFDVVNIEGPKNVDVPTSIAEIYDTFSKISGSDVHAESASAADFHGDGKRGDANVDIVTIKSKLRHTIKTSQGQSIINKLLGLVHDCIGLLGLRFLYHHVVGRPPVTKPSKEYSSIVQSCIDARLRPSGGFAYLRRAGSFVKHLYHKLFIIGDSVITDPSRSMWHHTNILKVVGDCSGRDFVLPGEGVSRSPVSIRADKVCSVVVEHTSCHVYNLHSDLGLYIAGGFIVKNCAGRDGKIYKVGKGPLAPAHWNCRSTIIPVVKPEFEIKGLKGKRPSEEGKVSPDVTYGDWLKRQSEDFQVEVLGPSRAELFRSGALEIERFRDETGVVYSLRRLEQLEPMAFQRAGVRVEGQRLVNRE